MSHYIDPFVPLKARGIRVIPVEEFDHDAVLVADVAVLLVACNLTTEERRQIASEYLHEESS